jgi:hypothetical protein
MKGNGNMGAMLLRMIGKLKAVQITAKACEFCKTCMLSR